jgi:prophage tail gpP-like protein
MASLPIQGKQYTVQRGDNLRLIATRAYGDEMKWSKIYRANASSLKSGNPNLISPGEVLFIPPETEIVAAKQTAQVSRFAGRSRETMTLLIAGKEVPILSARQIDAVDKMVSSWVVETDWIPGADPDFDDATKPYKYSSSEIYLGPELVGTGRLYTPRNKYTVAGRTKTLECFSTTADLMDSVMKPPYEFSDTLPHIAQQLAGQLGYPIIFSASAGKKFDIVTAQKSETIGAFLALLATQRGLLVTDDEKGNVVFLKAVRSASVGTIAEDNNLVMEWEAAFDGRKRFNSYNAVGQSGDADDIISTVKDDKVPLSRQYYFAAGDVDATGIEITAQWKRSRIYGMSLEIPFPVRDWYNPQGALWRKGQMVTVKSDTVGVPNGYTFYIRQTERILDSSGRSTILSLVPIEALTGEDLEDPWT